ncbi:DUF6177 family protein [Kribbella sp. NBC_01505]|uniref:DUF6177 family protein n=1 Tax=Kribbella sp. NBC_01505 TaxID=2903580 RepID=UPI003863F7A8
MPNQLSYSPGVDLITDKVAVVMQDRPVVGMSAWLSDALVAAKMEDRDVQLVTSTKATLTWPVRSMLFRGRYSRWVVTTGSGESFDGITGVRLKWNGDMFVPRAAVPAGESTSDIHPDFVVMEDLNGILQVTVRVRHKPVAATELGRVAELLFNRTTGAGPAGWSTSEPVTQPWSTEALTEYCRGRAPEPTWLVVTGQPGKELKPAVGTLEARRGRSGLDETVSLAIGQPGKDFPALGVIGDLIDEVADHFELISATVLGGNGSSDGTYQPRFVGMTCPVGLAFGNEAVEASSLEDMLAVEGINAQAIGPVHTPAVWYPVGDGRDPSAWERYATVVKKMMPIQQAADAAIRR